MISKYNRKVFNSSPRVKLIIPIERSAPVEKPQKTHKKLLTLAFQKIWHLRLSIYCYQLKRAVKKNKNTRRHL